MAVPFRIRSAEWVAGVLVLVTAFTLALSLLFVARGRGTFEQQTSYSVIMSDGHGLAPGATVEMLGIEVGRVDRVEITADNRVEVSLSVNADYASRVRTDSVARLKMSLGLQTMLGGVALVVSPGSPEATPLESGGQLMVSEPRSVADLLPGVGDEAVFDDVRTIVANTRAMTDELAQPQSELRQMVANLALLVASLQRGEGTVGQLMKDDAALYVQLTDTLARVETTLARVDSLTGKGGKLLDKSDAMLGSSTALVAKTDGVLTDAGTAFKKMDPLMDDSVVAINGLGETVAAFGKTTRELSEVLAKMSRAIDDLDDITRATKKVFPIRRHLDDKNRKPLLDGPSR